MLKTLVVALCSFALVTACGKKDEAKSADPKPAESKPGEAKAGDKPAAGAGFATAQEYEAKAMGLMDKAIAIFAGAGKDCDKLATDLNKFMDDNKAAFESATAFEKANPAAKAALDKKSEAKQKEFQDKGGPAIEACKDNKSLKAALEKMPD